MRIARKRIDIRILLRLVGLALSLACSVPSALADRDSSDIVKPPDVSAIPASELERWLRGSCRFDGGQALYEACVRTIASRLPPFDKAWPDHFGERYSPKKYVECRLTSMRRESGCDRFILRRNENPIFWPNPKVAMPRLPDAPKDDVYRPWMTKQKYFEALCKSEAGEFVFKTVEDVEGIYQIRPRAWEGNDFPQEDRYVMEDPYGYDDWESTHPHSTFVRPGRYGFLETPTGLPDRGVPKNFKQYRRIGSADKEVWNVQTTLELESRYGFLWRGIKRTRDRENNIGGGEILIMDLHAGEILAIKRGFRRGGPIRRSHSEIFWMAGGVCPGDSAKIYRVTDFVTKVLKPLIRGRQ